MSSRIRTLCDAIVSSLNATSFAMPFEARFAFAPVYTLEQLKDLRVTVTSRATEHEIESRGSTLRRITVDVAVQQMAGFDGETGSVDHDQVDELVQLTEAIADHFDLRALDGVGGFCWQATELFPTLMPEQLHEQHVYTGVVRLIYQGSIQKA